MWCGLSALAGQCSACHAWNTITEMRIAASPQVARNERLSGYAGNAGVSKVQKLSDIGGAAAFLHRL
jgi:DNA repair protein RadA/Sms